MPGSRDRDYFVTRAEAEEYLCAIVEDGAPTRMEPKEGQGRDFRALHVQSDQDGAALSAQRLEVFGFRDRRRFLGLDTVLCTKASISCR
jgi:hypothetical protein